MIHMLQCGRFQLDVSDTKIMGVLNCTPDSFSDGGQFIQPEKALIQAEKMIKEGVDIIDVGAESTRPGAKPVTVEEEVARLSPIISALVEQEICPISVDTRNAQTMKVMLDLGVDMINDVSALEDPSAFEVVIPSDCAICLMHMRGQPENMQNNTSYLDVVTEVDNYLYQRVQACLSAGIEKKRIVIDPGFGFGKTPEQNMQIVEFSNKFLTQDYPLLLGMSRKSTIGYYLDNRPTEDRMIGSVVMAGLASYVGVNIVRVHDVKETKDALKMVKAIKSPK